MLDRELILLVFAPATVGLVVTALHRTPSAVYWASLLGIITLTLGNLEQQQLGASSIGIDCLVFAMVLIVIPTIAAFSVGRMVLLSRGGAYVFAAACSAYLFGLGLAATIGVMPRSWGRKDRTREHSSLPASVTLDTHQPQE